MEKLLQLAKTLRKKCPWDKKQKMKNIPPMLIEEAQEILQAIEKKDWNNLKEEIGDVLFNLCLLIRMAEEKKHFTGKEVIDAIEEKIISRHTWVFGKDKATTPEEALRLWQRNKAKKRKNENLQRAKKSLE